MHKPRAVVHFAAESHVDRSILGPDDFIRTNVFGTFCVLEEARLYYGELSGRERDSFRFLQVSTDEVYGSLGPGDSRRFARPQPTPRTVHTRRRRRARTIWCGLITTRTSLPTLTTNCSNNYGPYQFPEKLIPLMILNAYGAGKAIGSLPVYGDGRERARLAFCRRSLSRRFAALSWREGSWSRNFGNIGGGSEKRNIEIVEAICSILDDACPNDPTLPHRQLITFVKDRPGHDRRYAVDARKIARELNWKPSESFQSGIRKTVQWYLDNQEWVKDVTSGSYRKWMDTQYS